MKSLKLGSTVLLDKVKDFLEVVGLGLSQFLVDSEHCDVTLAVTHGNPPAILRPPQTVKRTAILIDLLPHDGHFYGAIDVPYVNKSFSITGRENTWVCRTPLDVVDILLSTLER